MLASSALPPAFPPVEIDGEHYWDGSIYSNTPLDVVPDDTAGGHPLFCAAVFSPDGPLLQHRPGAHPLQGHHLCQPG